MKKVFKKLLLILMIFCIASSEIFMVIGSASATDIQPTQIGITDSTLPDEIASYELVAESSKLTMFADMKKGWFCIRDNANGYFWYSHPNDFLTDKVTVGKNRQDFQSEIVVNYVYSNEGDGTSQYMENSINSQTGALRNKTVYVEKIANGIKVIYDFYSIAARIPVTYVIENGIFKANILGSEILERKEFKNAVKDSAPKELLDLIQYSYITSIWLLPAFGASTVGTEGFSFVPDGCGALITNDSAGFPTKIASGSVYGTELAIDEYEVESQEFTSVLRDVEIKLPVFGIKQNNNAIVGIISKGDYSAKINAFKAGTTNNYTGVSSSANYRIVTSSKIAVRTVQAVSGIYDKLSDYEVQYGFINSDNLGIADFAEYYREYLIKEKNLKKSEYTPSVSLQVLGAIGVNYNFLGISFKKAESLTTVSQLKDILEELKTFSADSIAVNYVGWQNNGVHNNKIVKNAKQIKKLGSSEDFKELYEYIAKSNGELYLDADLLNFVSSGNGISKTSDAALTVFGKTAVQRKFSYATFKYSSDGARLLAPQKLEFVFERYFKSFKDQKFASSGLSFNSICNQVYSNFSKKKNSDRESLISMYEEIFREVSTNSLSGESANAYALPYIQRVYNAPNCSSRQNIYDEEVPFYQMVIHGYLAVTSPYINQCGNRWSTFLRAVETGSELAFLCIAEDAEALSNTDFDCYYSSTFDLWKYDFKEMYEEYKEILYKISDSCIIDYIKYNANISKTTYENGISIYVNYSDDDFVLDGDTVVPARSFIAEEG